MPLFTVKVGSSELLEYDGPLLIRLLKSSVGVAGVIFMPGYVRINRCARSFTGHVGFANTFFSGVGATLLRGHAKPRDGFERQGVKTEWQEKEVYICGIHSEKAKVLFGHCIRTCRLNRFLSSTWV